MPLDLNSVPVSGALKAVTYIYDEDLPRPIGIRMRFEYEPLTLVADPATDELVVAASPPVGRAVDVTSHAPWVRAHGRHCLWSWQLRNQTGHADGAQMLFAAPPEPDALVQLLVSASQIDVYELRLVNMSRQDER